MIYNQLEAQPITDADVEKYFGNGESTITDSSIETEQLEEKANSLAVLIFACIKKLIQMFAEVLK